MRSATATRRISPSPGWLARPRLIGLRVVDAAPQPVYGGTIRVVIRANGAASRRVEEIVERETAATVGLAAGLTPLADGVLRARHDVVGHLVNARDVGRVVVGYGAPARSITFLNALGIGRNCSHTSWTAPRRSGLA